MDDCSSDCPVEHAIRLVGGKWKLLLIRVLITEGDLRFNDMSRLVPDISHKVLTQNLRDLEEHDIIERRDNRYGVTKKGIKLQPILHDFGEWFVSFTPHMQLDPPHP